MLSRVAEIAVLLQLLIISFQQWFELRICSIEGELVEIIERRRKARLAPSGVLAATIFHREGHAVGDFRKSWATACKQAGLLGRIFHDFRRTAVRNPTRAGVPTNVAMAISGHKTDSIFRRYDIVNEADLAQAMKRLATYRENVVAMSK